MISIIVPVYNAEKYLSRCVDSIIAQTYPNWELLLINDGSEDKSGELCDEYAASDSRIRVFHKSNGGVSSARNVGLDNAAGEWITFVDSDDAIGAEMLRTCANSFASYEVIRFSMRHILSNDESRSYYCMQNKMSKEEYLQKIVSRDTSLGVCGGIYKSVLFDKMRIRFDTNLINGEDWVVLSTLIAASKTVLFLPDAFYLYNKMNEESCTKTMNFSKHISAIQALSRIKEVLEEMACFPSSDCFTKAKIGLGYDFVASRLLNSISDSKGKVRYYVSCLNLTKKEVLSSCTSLKRKALLLLLLSRIGQIVLDVL